MVRETHRQLRMRNRTTLGALLLVLAVGCTGGGGGGPTEPTAPPEAPVQPGPPDAGSVVDASRQDGGGVADAGQQVIDGGGAGEDSGLRGDPAFLEELIDGTGVHGQGAELLDVDADGDLDVVASFSLSDTVRIYLNEGAGQAWSVIEPIAEGRIVAMHAAAVDVDGDQDLDLAVVGLFDRAVGFSSAGEVTWFENPGDLQQPWTRHEITGLVFWAPLIIRAGDLTGDGRPDLVVSSIEIGGQGNGLFWFRNTGAGFSEAIPVEATLGYVSSAFVHDVDGDRDLDIVATSYSGGELVWFENLRDGPNEAPAFTRHVVASLPGPYALQLGQMDGDAEMEAVVTTATGGGGQVLWFDPPEDPRTAWTERVVTFGRGEGEVRLAVGDLDGDGISDVAMTSFERGEVAAFFGTSGGEFEPVQIAGDHVGANWITAGDVDADGRDELITTTYDYPAGDRVSLWRSEP